MKLGRSLAPYSESAEGSSNYDTEHRKCTISTTHGVYAKISIKISVLDAVKNPGLSSLLWLTITKNIGPLGHRIGSGKNQKMEKK